MNVMAVQSRIAVSFYLLTDLIIGDYQVIVLFKKSTFFLFVVLFLFFNRMNLPRIEDLSSSIGGRQSMNSL